MEKLSQQFKDALSRIEIRGDKLKRAIQAHSEIRGYLEEKEILRKWGIDTVLIGSYARHTGIYPGNDVDVFSKFTNLDAEASPKAVYETLARIIRDKYGNRVKLQPRSIKVMFALDGDSFGVDIVPAVRLGAKWGIPRRDRTRWDDPSHAARWIETAPEKLAELTSNMNSGLKIDGQGAYVPTVKLVRQTRHHHLSDEKPGGLYFELLTYWAFHAGIEGDCFAEVFTAALCSIASQLAVDFPLVDPVLGIPYSPVPDPTDLSKAAVHVRDLAEKAQRACLATRCQAAVIWRQVLGANSRGQCFPLPPGCDEEGNEIKKITQGKSIGSQEASGFA